MDLSSWNRKIDKNRNNFLFLSIFLLYKNRILQIHVPGIEKQIKIETIFYFCLFSYCRKIDKNRNDFLFLSTILQQKNRKIKLYRHIFLEQRNRQKQKQLSIFVNFSIVEKQKNRILQTNIPGIEKQKKIETTFYFFLFFYYRKIEKQNSIDLCSWNRKIDIIETNFLFLSIFLLQKNRQKQKKLSIFVYYSIVEK